MNFTSISKIFTVFTRVKTPLGRWNIHNHRETILKIKYATEDNCSGIYYNNYKNMTLIPKNNNLDDNEYIYLMGFESVPN